MFCLLKTEPSTYGFADLQKEDTTIWDGVSNPVALKHLREMKKGAKVVIYHTGDERQAVGTAAWNRWMERPRNPRSRSRRADSISHPVSLAEIKLSELFRVTTRPARPAIRESRSPGNNTSG